MIDLQTILGGTMAATLAAWFFGKAKHSTWYTHIRARLGMFSLELGCIISKWGNTYLRALWEPLETVVVDWFLFMAEQFAVGMRRDNAVKLQEHLTRLEDVGSQARAEVIREKLDAKSAA
jgi:hypothetical protein